MGMRAPKVEYTVDDLARMPDDGNRYEIIDGELLVTPAPRLGHQLAVVELVKILGPYADSLGLRLFVAPTDVRVSRKSQVEPDLFVVPRSSAPDHRALFVMMHGVLLAIEILSPSTAKVDRGEKRVLYQAQGVAEYWIVDVEKCIVDVWTPQTVEARTEARSLRWQPVAGRRALTIDLVALFASVRDDG